MNDKDSITYRFNDICQRDNCEYYDRNVLASQGWKPELGLGRVAPLMSPCMKVCRPVTKFVKRYHPSNDSRASQRRVHIRARPGVPDVYRGNKLIDIALLQLGSRP